MPGNTGRVATGCYAKVFLVAVAAVQRVALNKVSQFATHSLFLARSAGEEEAAILQKKIHGRSNISPFYLCPCPRPLLTLSHCLNLLRILSLSFCVKVLNMIYSIDEDRSRVVVQTERQAECEQCPVYTVVNNTL